jgi:fluoride ion exporter CrcB/FEX
MIKHILLVGLGGGIGSMARYLFQRLTYNIYPHHFRLFTDWYILGNQFQII